MRSSRGIPTAVGRPRDVAYPTVRRCREATEQELKGTAVFADVANILILRSKKAVLNPKPSPLAYKNNAKVTS